MNYKKLSLVYLVVSTFLRSEGTEFGECGLQPELPSQFIFEGKEALEGQFPWLVLLALRHKTTSATNYCGGGLISIRHIITAGHCVYM